jgi:hypothetical protein
MSWLNFRWMDVDGLYIPRTRGLFTLYVSAEGLLPVTYERGIDLAG